MSEIVNSILAIFDRAFFKHDKSYSEDSFAATLVLASYASLGFLIFLIDELLPVKISWSLWGMTALDYAVLLYWALIHAICVFWLKSMQPFYFTNFLPFALVALFLKFAQTLDEIAFLMILFEFILMNYIYIRYTSLLIRNEYRFFYFLALYEIIFLYTFTSIDLHCSIFHCLPPHSFPKF